MDADTSDLPAGLLRRLAALLYDTLLIAALLFVATAALLPLTGGEAITPAAQGALAYLYRGWLLLVAFGYFGLSWTRGGTLGMRAWHIRLVTGTGRPPGWPAVLGRFGVGALLALGAGLGGWLIREPGVSARDALAAALVAPLLLNFLWTAFDAGRRSLQDRACGMRLLRDG